MKMIQILGVGIALALGPLAAHAQISSSQCTTIVVNGAAAGIQCPGAPFIVNDGRSRIVTAGPTAPSYTRTDAVQDDSPLAPEPRTDFRDATAAGPPAPADLQGRPPTLLIGEDPLSGPHLIRTGEAVSYLEGRGMSRQEALEHVDKIVVMNGQFCQRIVHLRSKHTTWAWIRRAFGVGATVLAGAEVGWTYGGIVGLNQLIGEGNSTLHDQDTYLWLDEDEAYCNAFIDWKTGYRDWKTDVGSSLKPAEAY